MVNLRVIPAGWEERHAAVMVGTQTATVTIRDTPTDGETWVWDPVLKKSMPAVGAILHEEVTARLQRLREEIVTIAGGQEVTVHRYLIALPRDTAGVGVGCTIRVDTSTDPDLTGQTLHVVDEMRGSLRFERHLLAVDHLTPT